MIRFAPRRLVGQIALAMAVALLVAQAINFTLIFTERQRVSRAQIEGPAVTRFVLLAQRVAAAPPARRETMLRERGRRARFAVAAESIVPAGLEDPRLLDRLRDAVQANNFEVSAMRAAISEEVGPPPRLIDAGTPRQHERWRREARRLQRIFLSVQLPDGAWVNARMVTPKPNPWLALRPLVATLLTYLIILAAMVWIAARLTRPLRDLTAAAGRFQGRGEAPRVEPRGPEDISRAILAFNAMSARVSAMLDEKDRMLGAIGHDMRTPLASLRIRAEYMEPEAEREKVIATIEEMTAMLDDTLALARSGRATEPVRRVDITALADALVEEFRTLGHDAEMESDDRQVAAVRPNLLRRAVRNLIENGVRHGGSARVAVRATGDGIAIEVADSGPGIPEEELAAVQEPFVRLEGSRNRQTGGSGLGLTLARSAAQAHGGSLELVNRPEGGLLARILIPGPAA